MKPTTDTKQAEITLLLEAIRLKYGYDFSGYARDTLRRRFEAAASKAGCSTISQLIPKVLHEPDCFDSIIYELSITVTEMFRDPPFYLALRRNVIPVLKTYPFVNIWHAGCATGQEVYSMAILLKEEGIYDRARIYATDINQAALKEAAEAIYPVDQIPLYTRNYQKTDPKRSLADYYHAKYDAAKFDESLKTNVTFANHNLVTDGVFAEMHVILCRNVFIYFDSDLQNKTLRLFKDSLCRGGFLCLGSSESIAFSEVADSFVGHAPAQKIYRKKTAEKVKV